MSIYSSFKINIFNKIKYDRLLLIFNNGDLIKFILIIF